jgi:putative peptidoglycan lipid II flippase
MSLFRSSIVVTTLSVVVSGVSFLNQLVLANYFGAGEAMDLYLLASSIPYMCAALISAGLSYSLIPHLVIMQSTLGSEYKAYLGCLIKQCNAYLFILCLIGLIIAVFAIPFLYSNLSILEIEEARIIALMAWLCFVFGANQALVICVLNAKKEFFKPLFLSLILYSSSICITVLFYDYLGIISVALGVLLGTALTLAWGVYLIRSDFEWQFLGNGFKSVITKYLRQLQFAIVAMLTFTVYQSIDAFWAPKLGPSNLSYLGYSSRMIIAFGALIITGPSAVLVPRLTIALHENRKIDFFKDVILVIKLVLALSSVFAVIFIVLGHPITKILFERGAFSPEDTIGLSGIFPSMFTGMVFMVGVVILFRVLFLRESSSKLAMLGIIGSVSYFLFSGVFSQFWGLEGIAFAYLCTWVLLFSLGLYLLFENNFYFLNDKSTLIFVFKQCTALLLVYLTVVQSYSMLSIDLYENNFYQLVTNILISSTLGVIVFFFVSLRIIKHAEIIYFVAELKRLVGYSQKRVAP